MIFQVLHHSRGRDPILGAAEAQIGGLLGKDGDSQGRLQPGLLHVQLIQVLHYRHHPGTTATWWEKPQSDKQLLGCPPHSKWW